MKKAIIILIFSMGAMSADIPLELESIHASSSNLEISGFARASTNNRNLLAVSDNAEDTHLYEIELVSGKAVISKGKSIKDLSGFWSYYLKTLLWKKGGHWIKAPWDLEGIAICGETTYLANEQARSILELKGGKLREIPFNFTHVFQKLNAPLESISPNAGFEGVAVDCRTETVFIAQERGPRAIIVADLKRKKVAGHFQTPIVNKHPDYSDLFFDKGALYVLERNARRILKIDTENFKILSSASYRKIQEGFAASELYDTGEPYGVAEALFMDQDFIYVGNDNNGKDFSAKAGKVFGFKGNSSSILKFKRPQGF